MRVAVFAQIDLEVPTVFFLIVTEEYTEPFRPVTMPNRQRSRWWGSPASLRNGLTWLNCA